MTITDKLNLVILAEIVTLAILLDNIYCALCAM